jgi:hypothetical protein
MKQRRWGRVIHISSIMGLASTPARNAYSATKAALIGMGSSPGMTNVIARFASAALLDTTTSVDIFHTHGGEPFEGPGVIEHRFHCMSIPIPMYLDGELKYVDYFEPDGIALRQRACQPARQSSLRPLLPGRPADLPARLHSEVFYTGREGSA